MITPDHHGSKPVRVEDDVWIGTGAIVLPAVTVGRRSVVAAGAVVTKEVPPDSLYLGIQAAISPLSRRGQVP